jgi:hypothetical protein
LFISANSELLLRLASVAVPAFASLVLYSKCEEISRVTEKAAGRLEPFTNIGVVLAAARTERGRWLAVALVFAQMALAIAAYSWAF